MFTVSTKYLPSRGKVIARHPDGTWNTINYDYALHNGENHLKACEALVSKLDYGGTWVGGHTKDGYVFVCVETEGELRVVHDYDYMVLRGAGQI